MSIKEQELKLRVLALTGTYETSELPPECFAGVTGNFDGAGMSFGVLQFNMKSGTLQPMLRKMFTNHDSLMKDIFGDNYQELKDISRPISTARQIAWADSISVGTSKRSLKKEWQTQFKELGRTTECQQYQMEASKPYFDNALRYFKQFNFWSERAFALCFDICVQCGTIYHSVIDRYNDDLSKLEPRISCNQLEIEKMKILAVRRAEASNPKFVADVKSRKICIANGSGRVHGLDIDLEKDFNIGLVHAQIDA
jgi:hypothetical protein